MTGTTVHRCYFLLRRVFLTVCAIVSIALILEIILLGVRNRRVGAVMPYVAGARNLSRGLLLYAGDWDDRFPPLAYWHDVTASYSNAGTHLGQDIPTEERSIDGHFALNPAANCKSLGEIVDHNRWLLLVEYDATDRNAIASDWQRINDPRGNGWVAVGYASGNARPITAYAARLQLRTSNGHLGGKELKLWP